MQNVFLTKLFFISCLLVSSPTVLAELNVFACEPEWKALVDELGKDKVTSYSATTAFQDPHHIEARPSLISKVRRADLVICSGAELESAWLPLLIRQSANGNVLPGKPGYFEASSFVERLGIQHNVDRSMGDVHAGGNPHVHLDPRRLTKIADALTQRLIELDAANTKNYQSYHNDFKQRWLKAIDRWQQQAKPLKDMEAVVHHKDYVYLFNWLGIKLAGTLEPKPGLPTTVGHLVSLKNTLKTKPAKMILHTTYQSPRAALRLSQLSSIPVVELPYTVGGDDKATDLFSLFDVMINKLLKANK